MKIMKNLQNRLISSILLLCFCIGVFAVGSVYAARPAPEANKSASIFAPGGKNITAISTVINEKRVSADTAFKISTFSESGVMQSANKLKMERSKPDNDKLKVHPRHRRIIAHQRQIDLKRLAFANLQPEIVRLE